MWRSLQKAYFLAITTFQLLNCMLSEKLVSKETQSLASAATIVKQVLSGQVARRDIIPANLNFEESLKCSWLSNMLSGFSCLGSCMKSPSCSAHGCSNRSNNLKDAEKRLTCLGKKVAGPASSNARFMTKKRGNEQFTEDFYEVSYR